MWRKEAAEARRAAAGIEGKSVLDDTDTQTQQQDTDTQQDAAATAAADEQKLEKELSQTDKQEESAETDTQTAIELSAMGEAGSASTVNLIASEHSEERARAIAADRRRFPIRRVLFLMAAWVIVLVAALLRGGHGAPSLIGAPCGGVLFWVLGAVAVLAIVALAAFVARLAVRGAERRVRCNVPTVVRLNMCF